MLIVLFLACAAAPTTSEVGAPAVAMLDTASPPSEDLPAPTDPPPEEPTPEEEPPEPAPQ